MKEEKIIEHIVSNKEMLYREENMEKYINIIRNKIYIKNPFDRAIAAIFELVIEKEIDPLQIDLITFSKLYLEKLRKYGEINLVVAGKIILMAWKILKMQSQKVLKSMEEKEEEMQYDYDFPDWYADDEAFYYTKKTLEEELPLERKIRRLPSRKVTLIELINAFEEAKEEIKKRERKRKMKARIPANFAEHTHKEDIEKDIKKVMEKLSKLNGRAIPLSKLCNGKDELLSILLPLLFLAKEGNIIIWQENFPYGEIYVKVNHGS